MQILEGISSKVIGEFKMNNGKSIPKIGLGTYLVNSKEHTYNILHAAYKAGYRLFDTAVMYGNEQDIGNAIKKMEIDYGIKREELQITSKVLPSDMNRQACINSVNQTFKDLQTNYLDILLMHWPSDDVKARNETWFTMQELVESKKVLSIGVSNFTSKHIKNLISLKECKIVPCINQIELHPFYVDQPTVDFCKSQGIIIEAYSPFRMGDQKLLQNPLLVEIGKKYKKSSSQIIIKWIYYKNIISLPKSNKESHLKSNLEIFDFELQPDEIEKIDKLNCMDKCDWDPSALP